MENRKIPMTLNKKEIQQLSNALADLTSADCFLRNSVEKLSKFGTKIPSLPPQALEYYCQTVNSIGKSLNFVMSFVRVSALQQVTKPVTVRIKKKDENS